MTIPPFYFHVMARYSSCVSLPLRQSERARLTLRRPSLVEEEKISSLGRYALTLLAHCSCLPLASNFGCDSLADVRKSHMFSCNFLAISTRVLLRIATISVCIIPINSFGIQTRKLAVMKLTNRTNFVWFICYIVNKHKEN